ncbi:response regulator [Streptomyces flavofungini]|uniref:response regulator n=1 Tax=Streptomyces flavofungini TaxID=68200 RepID=UPI0025B12E5B|nr:response regulator transcription factor [Streptomyces flavofungini]WJV49395.1 response regulator transcription factor [Streptomyces flavofungini]
MAITVVIADDQDMVRTGFRMILQSQPDIEVLADVTDGAAALDAVTRHDPDVLLLDIRMPRLDGLEVTRRLAARPGVRPRIVIVTTFDLDEYVHAALGAGASGFLLKNASPAMLVEAVRAAAVGDALVSPAITVRLLRELAAGAPDTTASPATPAGRAPSEPLTQRERDVVRALARGRTNNEIAAELHVSLSTVKSHLANVQAKLDARNRVEIAAWAWESGLATRTP